MIRRLTESVHAAAGPQAQGLYVLPPLSLGLQPSLSETAEVWQGVVSGAAGKLEEQYSADDKQLKGRPSIRQSLVRAFQVRRPSILCKHKRAISCQK